jgi:hypothetical protein
LLDQSGQKEEARALLDRASQLDPANEGIQALRRRIGP